MASVEEAGVNNAKIQVPFMPPRPRLRDIAQETAVWSGTAGPDAGVLVTAETGTSCLLAQLQAVAAATASSHGRQNHQVLRQAGAC